MTPTCSTKPHIYPIPLPTPMNTELILVNISGYDRPGVTAALTDILARYDASILDISVRPTSITPFRSVSFSKTSGELSGNIMKDLLFKASELNVQIRFTPVPCGEYEEWVTMQGKNRWIVTHTWTPADGTPDCRRDIDYCRAAAKYRRHTAPYRTCALGSLETRRSKGLRGVFSARQSTRHQPYAERVHAPVGNRKFRYILQEDTMYRRCRRLVCFDMDSTPY